ncbi:MAG: penicillin acylase family protein, partial [Bacteroidetes bacterium]
PIVPEPEPLPWWVRRPPDPIPPAPADYHPDSLLMPFLPTPERQDEIVGSNNWVIAGSRSRTGYPLLANDPHLSLSQPSIWYEIQLHGPDHTAYGVTFPGAPGVILGFNDSVAWGATNGSRDVMDYYAVRFEDENREIYYYDGKATPVSIREEEIAVKGGPSLIDSVRYTLLGPILFDENYGEQPLPMAVRWMAHEPSNELGTFLRFNRARNYEQWRQALQTYVCPAQNFVFASADGDIAYWQQGRFVERWRSQGRFLLEAEKRDHHWNAFIPQEDNPHLYNPPEGYIGTANQHPTGPEYPHYYSGRFETFRGRRLHQLLAEKDTFDLEDMKRMQLDAYSMEAADLLPLLLADLDTTAFNPTDRQAYDMLRSWDYQYRKEALAPTVFQLWWDDLYYGIWRDEYQAAGVEMDFPSRALTIAMLHDSLAFSFYRSPGDTGVVTRPMMVNRSFNRILGQLQNKYDNMKEWQWGKWKQTQIGHLLPVFPSFGRDTIPTDGYRRILNATSERFGPSWRMVVALGPQVEAYGVYPGSQTGNPGNPRYGNTIDDWADGAYHRLWLLKDPQDSRAGQRLRQVLTPSPTKP